MSLLFVAALVTGCASSGTQIDQSKVQAIHPGVTTYDNMVRDFGPPLSQAFNQDGLLTAQWFYFYTAAFGMNQEQQHLTVLFNKDKTVKDVVSSASSGNGAKPGR